MTSPQDPDMEEQPPELEIEVEPPDAAESPDLLNLDLDPSSWQATFKDSCDRIAIWFNAIPSSGKLLVIAGGGLLGLTLLKTFLQLVTSLITLLVLGIIFYLVYRFWIAPKSGE